MQLLTTLISVLPILCTLTSASQSPRPRSARRGVGNETVKEFQWEDITPTADLQFHPCWAPFECARLSVPLDWTHPDNRTAAIAIVKLPAQVPESDPSWGGPVLVNPGGPGGSGVFLGLENAVQMQTVIGTHYSILGFDPRGVNNTTPLFSCFPDLERRAVGMKTGTDVPDPADLRQVGVTYARAVAKAQACSDATAAFSAHVGTAAVARDMLQIVEESWRRAGRGEEEVGRRGIRYWGFSYGSVLGATFASMFPTRVERVLLDGIVDADDYYSGDTLKNLQDADAVLAAFFNYCSISGPLLCAFHTGATPTDIAVRFSRLLATLQRQPLAVPSLVEIVTASDIQLVVFNSMYTPLASYPTLAQVLADVEGGDGTLLVTRLKAQALTCTPAVAEPFSASEAGTGVLCRDSLPIPDSLEAFEDSLGQLRNQSEIAGGIWALLRLGCVGWKQQQQVGLSFTGPFTGNTSWPLFFMGTTADPVTPLRNAHKMAAGYTGAAVLEQNSDGHCTSSSPSLCTVQHIREYFSDSGALPPPGTVCEVELLPFQKAPALRARSREDAELLQAVVEMGKRWRGPRLI